MGEDFSPKGIDLKNMEAGQQYSYSVAPQGVQQPPMNSQDTESLVSILSVV